ncbi:MAG: hypothetical protein JXB88_14990 [Spirochaetales bacterium]|nr:hypothetical protein [Spirochaetales bacterium]
MSSKRIIQSLRPAKTTEVYDTYWRFAAKRQEIFFRRLKGKSPPWIDDPILNEYKFTNAYRVSDRVSQYLIRNVIYQGDASPIEVFFRIILFKVFNKIRTWELLLSKIGEITYKNYSFDAYNKILGDAMRDGIAIYSNAYIMTSGKNSFGHLKKYQNHLKLIEFMIKDNAPQKIVKAESMKEVFELLLSYPTIGSFLAYQYTIDINYSELTHFSEMEFVVPGPGARDGIKKCFSDMGGLNEAEIIKLVTERQAIEFEQRGINFKHLWGRPLQLIDCQNLFCEVDKYARIAHPEVKGVSNRKCIKQRFFMNEKEIEYWYPPKWKINHLVRN